jgi:nucleoside 2-deoxyribosyltransferase
LSIVQKIIYQAGPLFSESERDWHRKLTAALEAAGHKVIWPGDLMSNESIHAAPDPAKFIFETCRDAIDRCNCVVALLDGVQVDDGTAWEIGYAYARGIPVYGIRTDFRNAGETPGGKANAMIEGCLQGMAGSIGELAGILGKTN